MALAPDAVYGQRTMKVVVEKSPRDLCPGDIVEIDGHAAEVLDAPFLGQSGASVFDRLELFWRARVRPLAGPSPLAIVTWAMCDRVRVR